MSNGTFNGKGPNLITIGSVICSIIVSTWIIADRVNKAKSDTITQMTQLDNKLRADFGAAKTNIESRITALESRPAKETWGDGDMYRWTVRLQRDNQNLKGANGIEFRVPEPPMKSDSPSR